MMILIVVAVEMKWNLIGYFVQIVGVKIYMITYKKGNLFNFAKSGVIAHGCNCRGGFGAGFAKYLAEQYPDARGMYFWKYNNEGWKLGECQAVGTSTYDEHGNNLWIVNCATQDRYWKEYEGERLVDYDALIEVFDKLNRLYKTLGTVIHMPKIGAGLAGGDWNKIKKLMESCFDEDTEVIVYEYDPEQK